MISQRKEGEIGGGGDRKEGGREEEGERTQH